MPHNKFKFTPEQLSEATQRIDAKKRLKKQIQDGSGSAQPFTEQPGTGSQRWTEPAPAKKATGLPNQYDRAKREAERHEAIQKLFGEGGGPSAGDSGSSGEQGGTMMQQPQFNPSRPQGTMANVVQTQGGGSHKPSVLGTLAGVGMGMATGNWAPLASHVLGSAAGGAMSAAQGSGTQTTGGETKSPGEGQPAEEGKKDSSMISGTGQVPEVGGGPVGQPQIQLPPEIHAALASMGFFGQPPGMALQQHAPQPMFGQPPMQGMG